jgi:hypothetical protein
MKRCLIVLTVCVLALVTGVQLAAANTPATGVQTADQSASSDQAALAASGAAQEQPSNTNVSIRVLSPGDDGSVSQTNSVDSDATAANENSATQDATQEQSSGSSAPCCASGSTGIQNAGQSATNEQAAAALSAATQTGASNTNVPVRVGSEGDNGSVSQTNSVDSDAEASNANSADQSADQTQSSGSGSSTGVQTADQDAESEQAAIAASQAEQKHPKNTNVSIRVLSPGDNGDVSQTNSVDSEATASNSSSATQSVAQDAASSGGGKCCSSGSTGVQTADQDAKSEQKALAASAARQDHPKNTNVSIRVLSPGHDGDVSQTNSVDSEATASNSSSTNQSIDQDQSSAGSEKCCASGANGIQVADQNTKNDQTAIGLSLAAQKDASNTNMPIRVKSHGDSGDVTQTNSVDSDANAANSSSADQAVAQSQSPGGSGKCCSSGATGIQVAAQEAKNEQKALGLSVAAQEGATNKNAPIRVKSPGHDGDVQQTNSVDSDATASNSNDTSQTATQSQTRSGGGHCCESGLGIQVAGQKATNRQAAAVLSLASQKGAANETRPLRVLSPGHDGDVQQSSSVDSDAAAANENSSEQTATQWQSPTAGRDKCCRSGLGIQVAGQQTSSEQASFVAAFAVQHAGRSKCGCPSGATNVHDPVRILSPGSGGSVRQSNYVDADASSLSSNGAAQSSTQSASGGGAGIGIQVAGQSSRNAQLAAVLAAAIQESPLNASNPLRVLSFGDGGWTTQSNSADADAAGANGNRSRQSAHQAR